MESPFVISFGSFKDSASGVIIDFFLMVLQFCTIFRKVKIFFTVVVTLHIVII